MLSYERKMERRTEGWWYLENILLWFRPKASESEIASNLGGVRRSSTRRLLDNQGIEWRPFICEGHSRCSYLHRRCIYLHFYPLLLSCAPRKGRKEDVRPNLHRCCAWAGQAGCTDGVVTVTFHDMRRACSFCHLKCHQISPQTLVEGAPLNFPDTFLISDNPLGLLAGLGFIHPISDCKV